MNEMLMNTVEEAESGLKSPDGRGGTKRIPIFIR